MNDPNNTLLLYSETKRFIIKTARDIALLQLQLKIAYDDLTRLRDGLIAERKSEADSNE